MNKLNYVYRKVKLTSLLVNANNPRFGNAKSQVDAIEKMIQDQNNKLYNLAEDIVRYGLNPSDLVIACKSRDMNDMFTVLEGNRRVVALKLLFQPELIPLEYGNLSKKSLELSKKSNLALLEQVYCLVFEDPKDADHWIEIKHTGELDGIGTARWDTKQQERFKANMGSKSISLQALEFVEQSSVFNKNTKKNIDSVAITNLERLLNDPDVRDFLGVTIIDNKLASILPKMEVAKGLAKIINDLSAKKINVNDIYYKKDRLTYLETFSDIEIPQKGLLEEDYWIFINEQQAKQDDQDEKGEKENKSTTKPSIIKSRPRSINRKCLIPMDCIIRIKDRRINDIYKELKVMSVDDFPNAAAVMLRVFLELSIDYFSNKKSIASYDINKKLVQKMESVIQYLQDNKILDKHQLKPARTVTSSSSSVFSTETLNAYVHNRLLQPNPKDLKLTWDNIELFLKTILMD